MSSSAKKVIAIILAIVLAGAGFAVALFLSKPNVSFDTTSHKTFAAFPKEDVTAPQGGGSSQTNTPSFSTRQFSNKYPVVLVHGFSSSGRKPDGKKQQWGQDMGDLQNELIKKGYNVMTAQVSPFSSNWHRACELYSYIKGGKIDYGQVTADKYGHGRYGRECKGLYPQWSKEYPIHIIAHSQGGQTSRMLAHLLNKGSMTETKSNNEKLSPLFEGNNSGMIYSITTLATPHDGTTMVDFDVAKKLLGLSNAQAFALLAGSKLPTPWDCQLEHWGFEKKKGESLGDWFKRVKEQVKEKDSAFAPYDMCIEGATEFNKKVVEDPNIYYMSYACQITVKNIDKNGKVSYGIKKGAAGFMTSVAAKLISIQNMYPVYAHNDGVVNTYSSTGPKLGRTKKCIKDVYVQNSVDEIEKGIWNCFGVIRNVEHNQIQGSKTNTENLNFYAFYIMQLNKIIGLEKKAA